MSSPGDELRHDIEGVLIQVPRGQGPRGLLPDAPVLTVDDVVERLPDGIAGKPDRARPDGRTERVRDGARDGPARPDR